MFSPDGEVDESFKVLQICKNWGRGHDMADRGSSDHADLAVEINWNVKVSGVVFYLILAMSL